METEDIIELSLIAVIVVVLGYVIIKALGFLGDSGVPQGIGSVLSDATAPITTAEDTLLGTGATAGAAGSNSNLFYGGISNFFSTGSIYGNQ